MIAAHQRLNSGASARDLRRLRLPLQFRILHVDKIFWKVSYAATPTSCCLTVILYSRSLPGLIVSQPPDIARIELVGLHNPQSPRIVSGCFLKSSYKAWILSQCQCGHQLAYGRSHRVVGSGLPELSQSKPPIGFRAQYAGCPTTIPCPLNMIATCVGRSSYSQCSGKDPRAEESKSTDQGERAD